MRNKIKGLVIRETPKGESDKILTLITDELGLINVKARGVRKISAAFIKSAQLFAFSEMLLYEKNGYYTMTEASMITDFYTIREDLGSYALACYVCEAAGAFTTPGETASEVLRLALNTLYAIENKSYPRDQIKAAFELRLCAVSGFAPDLEDCPECGGPIGEKGLIVFDEALGYPVCSGCSSGGTPIPSSVMLAMKHIVGSESGKFMSFRLDGNGLETLAEFAEKYLLRCAEKSFPTLKFYKQCEELA